MMGVSWEDSSLSEILTNPRLPLKEKQKIHALLENLPGHLWIGTSGSTSQKWVALSKKALLASAKGVNQHLQCTSSDIWLNPLPSFHVGGLGILARGHLSRASVISFHDKWNVSLFYQKLLESRATLTSLVPAQVFDLVKENLSSPSHLRAVVVGGGALRESLYFRARELGWPLLPSYGLTECASQVATAELESLSKFEYPKLRILPHVLVKMDSNSCFSLKSEALLTQYATHDPKIEGWFLTEDRGQIEGNFLSVVGRGNQFVKIGGESVSLIRLEGLLDEVRQSLKISEDMALFAHEDSRLGHVIHLAITVAIEPKVSTILEEFHKKTLPFERIRHVHTVSIIPRSPLKKLLRKELIESLFIS